MKASAKNRVSAEAQGVGSALQKATRFFHYSQNNSGGSFTFDVERGLTHHVVVEAYDSSHADERAEAIGLYFDGAYDCPCCGNRWSSAWGSGDEQACVYDEPVAEFKGHRWMEEGREVAVHYLDGRIEWC